MDIDIYPGLPPVGMTQGRFYSKDLGEGEVGYAFWLIPSWAMLDYAGYSITKCNMYYGSLC